MATAYRERLIEVKPEIPATARAQQEVATVVDFEMLAGVGGPKETMYGTLERMLGIAAKRQIKELTLSVHPDNGEKVMMVARDMFKQIGTYLFKASNGMVIHLDTKMDNAARRMQAHAEAATERRMMSDDDRRRAELVYSSFVTAK